MHEQGPFDELVRRLQAQRETAGLPSFGEIATRVSRVRRERGFSVDQARVGRTTVYDAFRLGRHRIDAKLIGDIARALGVDEDTASEWVEDARRARRSVVAPPAALPTTPNETSPAPSPAPSPVPAGAGARTLAPRWVVALLVACLASNLLGRVLVDALGLPVYLDMVGTACAAIFLGPWWGALVGAGTNGLGVAVSGTDSLVFLPVNVVGALVWGYGVRRFALARSIPRFFALNLLVAAVCSFIAVPTIVMVWHGFSGHGTDAITSSAQVFISSLWGSVTVSNLLTSVVDKLIAGFVALTVLEAMPTSLKRTLAPPVWLSGPPNESGADRTLVRACSG